MYIVTIFRESCIIFIFSETRVIVIFWETCVVFIFRELFVIFIFCKPCFVFIFRELFVIFISCKACVVHFIWDTYVAFLFCGITSLRATPTRYAQHAARENGADTRAHEGYKSTQPRGRRVRKGEGEKKRPNACISELIYLWNRVPQACASALR